MNRRNFLKNSLLFYGVSTLPAALSIPTFADTKPKNILVLGGTYFLGPPTVTSALAAGHTVTLFNRGITNPNLFPNLEKLRGFRSAHHEEQNLSSLAGKQWDAVIDVWPHNPSIVTTAAQLLRDKTEHYLYVSSISAYDPKDFAEPVVSEDAPLAAWEGTAGDYSRDKAESERRLRALIGKRLTIVRPCGIKGSRDDTPGDLLVWLRRMQEEQKIIAPGDGSGYVEIVDVVDVARFLVLAIDQSIYGTFNLTGHPMAFRKFLEECKEATHSDAELVWIPNKFLGEHGLGLSQHTPMWLRNFPYWTPDPKGSVVSSQKAFNAGWQTRPFRDTAMDFLEYFATLYDKGIVWVPSHTGPYAWRDPLPRAKEQEVIRLWEKYSSRRLLFQPRPAPDRKGE